MQRKIQMIYQAKRVNEHEEYVNQVQDYTKCYELRLIRNILINEDTQEICVDRIE